MLKEQHGDRQPFLKQLAPVVSWREENLTISAGLSWVTFKTSDGERLRVSGEKDLVRLHALVRSLLAALTHPAVGSGSDWLACEKFGESWLHLVIIVSEGSPAIHLSITDSGGQWRSEKGTVGCFSETLFELHDWLAMILDLDPWDHFSADGSWQVLTALNHEAIRVIIEHRGQGNILAGASLTVAQARELQRLLLRAATGNDRAVQQLDPTTWYGVIDVIAGRASTRNEAEIALTDNNGMRACRLDPTELIQLAADLGIHAVKREELLCKTK